MSIDFVGNRFLENDLAGDDSDAYPVGVPDSGPVPWLGLLMMVLFVTVVVVGSVLAR